VKIYCDLSGFGYGLTLNRRVKVEQQIGEKTLTLVWLLFVQ